MKHRKTVNAAVGLLGVLCWRPGGSADAAWVPVACAMQILTMLTLPPIHPGTGHRPRSVRSLEQLQVNLKAEMAGLLVRMRR
jgi:hypothetical protein